MTAGSRAVARQDRAQDAVPTVVEAEVRLNALTGQDSRAWRVIRRELMAARKALREYSGGDYSQHDVNKLRREAAKWRTRCRAAEARVSLLEGGER